MGVYAQILEEKLKLSEEIKDKLEKDIINYLEK